MFKKIIKILFISVLFIGINSAKAQNYSTLKTFLDANITTNGSRSITGAILNNFLTDMLLNDQYLQFDTSRTYQIGDVCVYDSLFYYFHSAKTNGIWDDTKAAELNRFKTIYTDRLLPLDSTYIDVDSLRFSDGTILKTATTGGGGSGDSSWVLATADTLQINAGVGNNLSIQWDGSSFYDFVSSGSYNIRFDVPSRLTTNTNVFYFNDEATPEFIGFLNDTIAISSTSLAMSGSGFNAKLTSRMTSNKEIFLPDSSGTIALLSNITGGSSFFQRDGDTLSPINTGDKITTTGWINTDSIYYIDDELALWQDCVNHRLFLNCSGNFTMTGDYNMLAGEGSGSNMTSGTRNTSFGYNALKLNTTGSDNFAFGFFALRSNTTGSYNIAMGYRALNENTTAIHNIGMGYESLRYNTGGDYNFAIGSFSLNNNTTGDYNVAIGYKALQTNTTAIKSVAIGTEALYSSNFSGLIAIGYRALYACTGANNLAIGLNAGDDITTGLSNLCIGTNAGGSFTTANYNTFIGNSAGSANTGSNNLAIGNQSYYLSSGGANLFIGNYSGYDCSGNYNIGIGQDALRSGATSTGVNYNTGIGSSSLYSITQGDNNVAIGYEAGYSNETGIGNVFIGYQAGYNETGSAKLYIENSNADSDNALIYGEFANDFLRVNGSLEVTEANYRSITTVNAATYDLTGTDFILNVTYTGTAAVTSLTLPTAETEEGRIIVIKDAGGNAGSNNITIDTEAAQTIDGSATLVINGDYDSVSLYCDGSNWFIY